MKRRAWWLEAVTREQTDSSDRHRVGSSPSSGCSDLKTVSAAPKPLPEFPRRSGREEDTETTEGFRLHFKTDGNSSTTGNSSGTGNSSCSVENGQKHLE